MISNIRSMGLPDVHNHLIYREDITDLEKKQGETGWLIESDTWEFWGISSNGDYCSNLVTKAPMKRMSRT